MLAFAKKLWSTRLEYVLSAVLIAIPLWQFGLPYWKESRAAGAAMEEQALLYISATNIGKDFFANWGVADYGLNEVGAPIDKVFYVHFMSGPDVILAALLRLGISDNAIRHLLILVSLSFIPLAWIGYRKIGLRPLVVGILLSFLLSHYEGFWAYTDHYVFSYLYPTTFLGFLGLTEFLQNKSSRPLKFLLAVVISYFLPFISTPALVIAGLIMILIRKQERSRNLKLLFLTISALIIIHVIRNSLVLGWRVALKDIFLTFGNRTIGKPSKSEMKDFYSANNLALWGTDNSSIRELVSYVISVIQNYFILIVLMTFLVIRKSFVLLKTSCLSITDLSIRSILCAIVSSTSFFTWYFLFPNHAKNYVFPPFVALGVVFALAAVFPSISDQLAKLPTAQFSNLLRNFVLTFLPLVLVSFFVSYLPGTYSIPSEFKLTVIFGSFLCVVKVKRLFLRKNISSRLVTLVIPIVFFATVIVLTRKIGDLVSFFDRREYLALGVLLLVLALFGNQLFLPSLLQKQLVSLEKSSLCFAVCFVLVLWVFTIAQPILERSSDAVARGFGKSYVEELRSLPRLKGSVWTNINAPFLFRYTGGLVNGYCNEVGLKNLDQKNCYSGRFSQTATQKSPYFVVLSKAWPSGDSSCFYPDPCYERVLSYLSENFPLVWSSDNFSIFKRA